MATRLAGLCRRARATSLWATLLAIVTGIALPGCGSSSTTTTVGPTPTRCETAVSPAPSSFPASGGSGTLTVSAARECSWSASSGAEWISLSAPVEGQGNGTVRYTVAPNPVAQARTGTLLVGSVSTAIRQEAARCRFELSRRSFDLGAGASGGDVDVKAPAGCAWEAKATSAWIDIMDGVRGSGPGRVRFRVEANPTIEPRTAALEVAGLRVDIRQNGIDCHYQIDPPSIRIDPGEAEGAIAIEAEAACPWTATSLDAWLTLVGDASGSGPGQIRYRAAANDGQASRMGRINVAGLEFVVEQDACSYVVSPTSRSFGAFGGNGEIRVQAHQSCRWSATSTAGWILVTSGSSGTGAGEVSYTVRPNLLGGARTGSLDIAGQTVTIAQGGPFIEGAITAVHGSCPSRQFRIRSQDIRANGATSYEGGRCRDLRNGVVVRVRGTIDGDGVLVASEIDF